jgi:hypothetical protein
MRYGAIFWGTLIILVGAALLTGNLLGISVWPFLWPSVLIFIGIWFLVWSRIRPKSVAGEEVVIDRMEGLTLFVRKKQA